MHAVKHLPTTALVYVADSRATMTLLRFPRLHVQPEMKTKMAYGYYTPFLMVRCRLVIVPVVAVITKQTFLTILMFWACNVQIVSIFSL